MAGLRKEPRMKSLVKRAEQFQSDPGAGWLAHEKERQGRNSLPSSLGWAPEVPPGVHPRNPASATRKTPLFSIITFGGHELGALDRHVVHFNNVEVTRLKKN